MLLSLLPATALAAEGKEAAAMETLAATAEEKAAAVSGKLQEAVSKAGEAAQEASEAKQNADTSGQLRQDFNDEAAGKSAELKSAVEDALAAIRGMDQSGMSASAAAAGQGRETAEAQRDAAENAASQAEGVAAADAADQAAAGAEQARDAIQDQLAAAEQAATDAQRAVEDAGAWYEQQSAATARAAADAENAAQADLAAANARLTEAREALQAAVAARADAERAAQTAAAQAADQSGDAAETIQERAQAVLDALDAENGDERAQAAIEEAEALIEEAGEALAAARNRALESLDIPELTAVEAALKGPQDQRDEAAADAAAARAAAGEARTAADGIVEEIIEDPDGASDDVTIEEGDVPLTSGPVTRGQFVDFLWRHEGAFETEGQLFNDVPADHEFAEALRWGRAIEIVIGVGQGNFQPDELVSVRDVRTILTRYAAYQGVELPALTTLTGEEREPAFNCDEVIAEYFGDEAA